MLKNINNQNKQIAMLGADRYKMSARDVVLPYAIASWQQQAGYVAPKMPVASVSMSQYETQPYCSDAAANYLRDMLGGTHTLALEEWVLLMRQTGQLAPPEYLPTLLELGKEDKFMRPYIVKVGGNRVLWLAVQDDIADWVTEVAANLSDYLCKAHAEASQEDAISIGTLRYQIKHSEPKYTDNKPEAQRRILPKRGGLIDEYPLSLDDLYRATGLWSAMLSEAFMEGAYVDFFNYIHIDSPQFAYRLSLQIEHKRLQAWQNVMCRRFQKSSEVFQQTMPIIEYRRNMRQAVEAI